MPSHTLPTRLSQETLHTGPRFGSQVTLVMPSDGQATTQAALHALTPGALEDLELKCFLQLGQGYSQLLQLIRKVPGVVVTARARGEKLIAERAVATKEEDLRILLTELHRVHEAMDRRPDVQSQFARPNTYQSHTRSAQYKYSTHTTFDDSYSGKWLKKTHTTYYIYDAQQIPSCHPQIGPNRRDYNSGTETKEIFPFTLRAIKAAVHSTPAVGIFDHVWIVCFGEYKMPGQTPSVILRTHDDIKHVAFPYKPRLTPVQAS